MAAKSEIVECLTVLSAKIPNSKAGTTLYLAYAESLCGISIETIEAALAQGLTVWKFFPSLAEIFDQIGALTSRTSLAPSAGEAWGIVLREIQRTGFYQTPKFESELIAKAVSCLDWKYLCTSEDQMADRAHFMKIYDQLKARADSEDRLLPRSIEMRDRLRLASKPAEEPRQLRAAPQVEAVGMPAEFRDAIKQISGKFSIPAEPPSTPAKVVSMPTVRMICSNCSRKVDSRMGWTLGESCSLPTGNGLCPGYMVEAQAKPMATTV